MTTDQLNVVFGALADPTRRAILARLTDGDLTVGELAAPFTMSRQAGARRWAPVTAPLLGLLSVLALRALVIFSAQS